MTLKEIYLEAVYHECPACCATAVEYEIGSYLLEKMKKDEIHGPILKEKLLWLIAYRLLFDIECNQTKDIDDWLDRDGIYNLDN